MDEQRLDRILSDLRSELEDWDEDEPWADAVETAMNAAWEALLKLVPDASA